MAQYHVLASEGRQRYTIYTKTPKNIQEKKNCTGLLLLMLGYSLFKYPVQEALGIGRGVYLS
jgi:hypothetical protein